MHWSIESWSLGLHCCEDRENNSQYLQLCSYNIGHGEITPTLISVLLQDYYMCMQRSIELAGAWALHYCQDRGK